jgi:hypothetical protein
MTLGSLVALAACGAGPASAIEVAEPVHEGAPADSSGTSGAYPPRDDASAATEDGPGLEANQVSSTVTDRYGSFGGCHTLQYSGSTDGGGSLTLAWEVRADGSVNEARVVASSFRSEAFHDCIVTVLEATQFPAASGTTEVGGWEISFRGQGAISGL